MIDFEQSVMPQIHVLSDRRQNMYFKRCKIGTEEYAMTSEEFLAKVTALTAELEVLWDKRRGEKAGNYGPLIDAMSRSHLPRGLLQALSS